MTRAHDGASLAHILLEHGVVGCLREGAQGALGRRVAHGVILAGIGVGTIHYIICISLAEEVAALGPPAVHLAVGGAAALPFGLCVVQAGGRCQKQARLANDAAEVGFHLYTIDPAFLDGLEAAYGAQRVGNLALHRMLVAAAAEIEVAASVGIVEIDVCVDDGIVGVEDGAVHQVHEGTCGAVAHGYAYLEVLHLVGGVLAIVGAEEHIVASVALIDLGGPEAVLVPLSLAAALIDLAAGFPRQEVVADEGLEAILQRGAVHIVASVAGMEQVGVAELQRNGIHDFAGHKLGFRVAARQHNAKAEAE